MGKLDQQYQQRICKTMTGPSGIEFTFRPLTMVEWFKAAGSTPSLAPAADKSASVRSSETERNYRETITMAVVKPRIRREGEEDDDESIAFSSLTSDDCLWLMERIMEAGNFAATKKADEARNFPDERPSSGEHGRIVRGVRGSSKRKNVA